MAEAYQNQRHFAVGITVRVIVPHLFDGVRRSRLYGTDAMPVAARKQCFGLCVAPRLLGHHQPA
ncbi:hypothetical protein LNK15_12725, partial [Jeotgalicoccus huakuii]|nr:hypothetical protein [Jeotgalicoccus huakuii]